MARGRGGRGGRRREDRQKAKQRQINRALKLSEINSKARYQQEEYLRRRQQAEKDALKKAQGESSQQSRPDKNDEASSSSSSESEDERQTAYDLLVTSLQSNRDQSSSEEISESEEEEEEEKDSVQEEEDDIESDEDIEEEEGDAEDVSTDNEEEEAIPEDQSTEEEKTLKGKKRKKEDDGQDGILEQRKIKKKLKATKEQEDREEQEKEGQWSSDGESEGDDLEEEKSTTGKDPFWHHLTTELQEDQVDKLGKQSNWTRKEAMWKGLGRLVHTFCTEVPNSSITVNKDSINKMNVKGLLCTNWIDVNGADSQKNAEEVKSSSDGEFTARQRELFSLMHGYKDLYYSERTHRNGEELRKLYCLHALNHVLKTRSVVTRHNTKLKLGAEVDPDSDEYQDQGLTRPKVLLVVPFREAALRTVHIITQLMRRPDGKPVEVMNKKRFQDEYSEIEHAPPKVPLPEDFEATFAGNIDDHFRIGLAVSRRNIRLYSPFYLSDIIIASPLGLRTVIGAEGEKDRDYDFLSSIEVLILDQADTYLMQNWEHIQHLMQHMHLQPKETHETDFSRVRIWYLNGWAKYYRQTLIFSSITSPEINAIFNKQCHNYSGKVQVSNPPTRGTICQVALQLPQVFRRVECSSFTQAADARFNFFVSQILPQIKDGNMQRTLFFIPSYFDFVRIRNFFRQEDITFAQICEYTTQANISRARQYFQQGDRPFLLFTERFHFFRRYRIKGIRSLVFYELPLFPHFYSELCNMLEAGGEEGVLDRTCTVLYTKYDAQRLAAVVGASRCGHMITSGKSVHMFVTGEQG
ncbi:digestive organ expansion factor homolog [Branchiostoma floridae]|uniref:U3 small nucleolar RNA-associated protein 25 homolog n=1 Tax=Branchiostoma floridae TaxID=7739 RepID=A0A9J7KKT0_BRAFL|nr:digestive organ expansion factor homolog [Branchiostoma floridae]